MKIFYKIISIFILLLIFTPVNLARGAEIRLVTDKLNIKVGDQFLVEVVVDATLSLNALQGKLLFPVENLLIKEIRDGNSVINFWVEKPEVKTPGEIVFSGIVPGGFTGTRVNVFSIVLEARQVSNSTLILEEIKALQNDGLGTEDKVLTKRLLISTERSSSNLGHKEELLDKELPESFVPVISKNEAIFDNKYFLVFATQDKASGIDHYEVREGWSGEYLRAESPYLLNDQSLSKKIFIKSIDKRGNERLAVIKSKYPLNSQQFLLIFSIILLVLVIAWWRFKKPWLKFTH